MSEYNGYYPLREGTEATDQFRRVGRAVVSIAEGPVEIKIGKTSLFILNPTRDLSDDYQLHPELAQADCVVATTQSLLDNETDRNGSAMITLRSAGEHAVFGREHDPFNYLVTDDFISRYHVLVDRSPHGLTVHDLGSVNGTYIRNLSVYQSDWTEPTYSGNLEGETRETAVELSSPQVKSSMASDRHPETNEDAVFSDEVHDALGVFDGVGSSQDSGRASQLAANFIQQQLSHMPTQVSRGFAQMIMGETLLDAHQEIVKNNNGAQTTAAVARFFKDDHAAPYAIIAHAGDSRAYLLRDGKLEVLTVDHAYTGSENELRRKDLQNTLAEATNLSNLSDEARDAFRRRHIITSALGSSSTPTISFATVDLIPGDILILTSDGVHDNLTTTEIQNVAANAAFQHLADEMVAKAHDRSRSHHIRSKTDDITAAAVVYQATYFTT